MVAERLAGGIAQQWGVEAGALDPARSGRCPVPLDLGVEVQAVVLVVRCRGADRPRDAAALVVVLVALGRDARERGLLEPIEGIVDEVELGGTRAVARGAADRAFALLDQVSTRIVTEAMGQSAGGRAGVDLQQLVSGIMDVGADAAVAVRVRAAIAEGIVGPAVALASLGFGGEA